MMAAVMMLTSSLLVSRCAAFAFRTGTLRQQQAATTVLRMSSAPASTKPLVIPRVKAVDAKSPSEGPVYIKGWVRTVRKQKTLAFVEVNDGSNLGGIQCVLSFDAIDGKTQEGMF
jgi:hypothetical protein